MEFLNQWALPILILWPLLSAILVFLTKNEKAIKWGSVAGQPAATGAQHLHAGAYDYASGEHGVRGAMCRGFRPSTRASTWAWTT